MKFNIQRILTIDKYNWLRYNGYKKIRSVMKFHVYKSIRVNNIYKMSMLFYYRKSRYGIFLYCYCIV